MQTQIKMIVMALFTCLIQSCVHYSSGTKPNKVIPLSDSQKQLFEYPKKINSATESFIRESAFYTVKSYSLQSSIDILHPQQKPHSIHFEIYYPKKKLSGKAILCLPISGGNYPIAGYFTKYFSKRGYTSVLIKRRQIYKNMITVERLNTIIRQMVMDHMQVMDFLESNTSLNIKEFALVGTSQGGIKSSIIAAIDTRVKTSIIAIAGGDIPYILTHSNESGVIRRREEYFSKMKMNPDDFEKKLRSNFQYDPIHLAKYIDSSKVMIINAYFDTSVPYICGKRLSIAHKGCEEVVLFTGHYSAILLLPCIAQKAEIFLRKQGFY
ncbi:MAG: hypothetical protein NE330_07740 [Lentisphaeraceae bacterium]|nr:hypothetical protein [Lentisphaeraceae bacterium]